jgi:hypothetical protein
MKYFCTCGQPQPSQGTCPRDFPELPAHVSGHVSFPRQPPSDASHIELIVGDDELTYSVIPPLPLIHIQYIYILQLVLTIRIQV